MTTDCRRKLAHPPFLMGRPMRVIPFLFAVLLATFSLPASAQAPLKLGLLLDMAGPYADIGGQGSVTAARMAVDDFGGKVLDRPIEIVFADHRTSPTPPPRSPDNGSTTSASRQSWMWPRRGPRSP
jgi:Periplasmic binding protein